MDIRHSQPTPDALMAFQKYVTKVEMGKCARQRFFERNMVAVVVVVIVIINRNSCLNFVSGLVVFE